MERILRAAGVPELAGLGFDELAAALVAYWNEALAEPRDLDALERAGVAAAGAGAPGLDDLALSWAKQAGLGRGPIEVFASFCTGYWRHGPVSAGAVGACEVALDALPRTAPEWAAPLLAADVARGRPEALSGEVLGRLVARIEGERRVLETTGLHPEALGRLTPAPPPIRAVPLIYHVPIHLLLETAASGGPCEVLTEESESGTGWETVRVLLGYGDADRWLTFSGPSSVSLSESRLQTELGRLEALREAIDDARRAIQADLAWRRR